jgi:type IV fimbrial biogenesis protein FimT
MKKRNSGFTLIELMLTISIAAVLMAVGIPAMQDVIINNRIVTEANELVTHISLARSEAIKRNRAIVICISADPNAVSPACGGTSQDWSSGWITFVDDNGNNAHNAGELILRVGNALSGNTTIKADTEGATFIGFNGDGSRNRNLLNLRIAICAGSDEASGRELVIDSLGRSTMNRPPASCEP